LTTNLLRDCEIEEDFERQYVAELAEQQRKGTERLLTKALSLSRKGELASALVYATEALRRMREMRESGR